MGLHGRISSIASCLWHVLLPVVYHFLFAVNLLWRCQSTSWPLALSPAPTSCTRNQCFQCTKCCCPSSAQSWLPCRYINLYISINRKVTIIQSQNNRLLHSLVNKLSSHRHRTPQLHAPGLRLAVTHKVPCYQFSSVQSSSSTPKTCFRAPLDALRRSYKSTFLPYIRLRVSYRPATHCARWPAVVTGHGLKLYVDGEKGVSHIGPNAINHVTEINQSLAVIDAASGCFNFVSVRLFSVS